MSVRFKFKNDLEFVTLPCDGYNISVKDLKRAIIRSRHLGRVTDFDLTVSNNQTGEVYNNEEELIPKNSTLVIARHPLPSGQKKEWEEETFSQTTLSTITGFTSSDTNGSVASIVATLRDSSDPSISEDAKLQTMMSNSSEMYDQKNWKMYKGKAAFAGRPLPKNLRCSKCNQGGHFPTDCTFGEVKKTTGIPRSFLKPASAETLGAKMNPHGLFMVNELEQKAYSTAKIEKPMWEQDERPSASAKIVIPDDLKCPVCNELLRDAVMMPACACAMCDECARDTLIQSVNNACPSCNTPDNSPDDLIPWREQRKKVSKFRAENGLPSGDSPLKQSLEVTRKVDEKPVLPEIHLPNFNDARFDSIIADTKNSRPPSAHTMFPSPEHMSSASSNDSPTGISPRGRKERSSSSSSSSSSDSDSTATKESQGTPTEKSPSPVVQVDSRNVSIGTNQIASSHFFPPLAVRLPDTSLPPPGFQIGHPLGVPVLQHRFPVTLPSTVPTHHPPPFSVVPPGIPISYGVPQMAPIDLLRDKDGFVTDPLAAFNAAMLRKDRRHRRNSRSPPRYKRKFTPPRRRKSQSPQRVPRGPRTPPHPPMSPSHDHSPGPRSLSPGRSPNRSPGFYHHGSPLRNYSPEPRGHYGYPPPPRRDYLPHHDDYRSYSSRGRGYRNPPRGPYRHDEGHRSYSGDRSSHPKRSSHKADKDFREPRLSTQERVSREKSKSIDRTPSLSPEQDSRVQHKVPLEDPTEKEIEAKPEPQISIDKNLNEPPEGKIDREGSSDLVESTKKQNDRERTRPIEEEKSRHVDRQTSGDKYESKRHDHRNDNRDTKVRRDDPSHERRRPETRREENRAHNEATADKKQGGRLRDKHTDERQRDNYSGNHRRSERGRDDRKRNNNDDRRNEDQISRRHADERGSNIKPNDQRSRDRPDSHAKGEIPSRGTGLKDRHVERNPRDAHRSKRMNIRDTPRENPEDVGRILTPIPSDDEPRRKKSKRSLSESELKDRKKRSKKKKSESEKSEKKKRKKVKREALEGEQNATIVKVEDNTETNLDAAFTAQETSAIKEEPPADELIQIHADKSELLDVDTKFEVSDVNDVSNEMAPIPASKWENDETDEDRDYDTKELKKQESVSKVTPQRSEVDTSQHHDNGKVETNFTGFEKNHSEEEDADLKKSKKKKKEKKKKKTRDGETEEGSSSKRKKHPDSEEPSKRKKKISGDKDDHSRKSKKKRRKEKFEQEAIRSLVMAITENGLKPEMIAQILKKGETAKPSRSHHDHGLSPRRSRRDSSNEGSPMRHHRRNVNSNGRHISVSITKQSSRERSRRRSRSVSSQNSRNNRNIGGSKNEKPKSPLRASLKDRLGPKVSDSRSTRERNRSRERGQARVSKRSGDRNRKH